jgi:hypothetical protein
MKTNTLILYAFLCFFINCKVTHPAECYPAGDSHLYCKRVHENGKIKAIEIMNPDNLCPLEAHYFYPNGSLMAEFNWDKKFFLKFSESGALEEVLDNGRYKYFQHGELINECDGTDCLSHRVRFVQIPKSLLKPGDVIFTSNLNQYSGAARAEFTHLNIVTEIKNGQVKVLGNDMFDVPEITPLEDAFSHTMNYMILRNPEFSSAFFSMLKANPSLLKQRQFFCTSLYYWLLKQAFPERVKNWTYFQTFYPEIIAHRSIPLFQEVESHFTDFNSTKEFYQKRKQHLVDLEYQWDLILEDPEDYLYRIFFLRFPFTPLVFHRDLIHELLQYFQLLNPLRNSRTTMPAWLGNTTDTILKIWSENRPLQAPETGDYCHRLLNQSRFCLKRHPDGAAKSLEYFKSPGSTEPLEFYYFREDGSPIVMFDSQRKHYSYFYSDNSMAELFNGEEYYAYKNHKQFSWCQESTCLMRKGGLLQSFPEDIEIQPGDIIFTGNLYPHSGRIKTPITHVSIVYDSKPSDPLVISNDIYQSPAVSPFSMANGNTYNIIILRNASFSSYFQNLLKKDQLKSVIHDYKTSNFCNNLLIKMLEDVFPEQIKSFDEVDRNFAELTALKILPFFSIIYEKLTTHKSIGELTTERANAEKQIKNQVRYILNGESDYFYRLFETDFPLLPITFSPNLMHSIYTFMNYNQFWGIEPDKVESSDASK